MPIVLRSSPMMRRRVQNYRGRGMGVTCPTGLVATANGGCVDPNSVQAQKLASSGPAKAVTYASAPGCNVVNLQANQCMLADGTITGCNIIQECAPLTGQQRCQFGPFPGQTADPSLPFCSGNGPSISYTPNPNLATPTGPSTPFTPTELAPNAVAVGSAPTAQQVQALIAATVPPSPAASPAPITNGTPPATGNGTTVVQSNAPSPTLALPASFTDLFSSDASGDWFTGVPNWLVIGAGVLGVGLWVFSGGKR